jgi:hypothetical protein
MPKKKTPGIVIAVAPVRHVRPSHHSVNLLIEIDRSPIVDEAQLAGLESIATRWDHRFARRQIGKASTIILLARTNGPVLSGRRSGASASRIPPRGTRSMPGSACA